MSSPVLVIHAFICLRIFYIFPCWFLGWNLSLDTICSFFPRDKNARWRVSNQVSCHHSLMGTPCKTKLDFFCRPRTCPGLLHPSPPGPARWCASDRVQTLRFHPRHLWKTQLPRDSARFLFFLFWKGSPLNSTNHKRIPLFYGHWACEKTGWMAQGLQVRDAGQVRDPEKTSLKGQES